MTGAQSLRLLLVEDELLNRVLVKAILARASDERLRTAQLREADTLAAARRMLAEAAGDLVLLDIQLPDGSGLDLAGDVSRLPADERPIVVAVTAGALPEQREAALAAGCISVVTKPYSAEDFEATIAAAVDGPP